MHENFGSQVRDRGCFSSYSHFTASTEVSSLPLHLYLLPLINMPRFGFVGDEEVSSASPPKPKENGSKMSDTAPESQVQQPRSETQREEVPPPSKHVDPTEQQRSLMKESYTEPEKTEIAPLEDGTINLEKLVEKEAARCAADPLLLKEARDAAEYVEGEKKVEESTVKAPVVASEEDQYLLEEVCTNWTTGKKNHQTARCISAIRNCLLQGIKQVTIASYVAYYGVEEEEQAVELKRIKDCARKVNKALKKESQGAAEKAAEGMLTTRSTDLEDLISKGIPYQRNGVVFVRGDALQKTASVELEEGMAALNLSPEAKDANATTQKSQINPNLKEADQVKNEQHWMTMWKDAKTELKKLREELKGETDEEIKDELKSDIDCLKKKKDEWAMLLGMK